MKLIILYISVFIFSFSSRESPNDYDYKLSYIVREFKSVIMDKNKCDKLKKSTNELSNQIHEALENSDVYNHEEIGELIKLEQEAMAIEDFIASVGDCGNYIPSIKNIYLANQRIKANINIIIKDRFCVDIITVTIGEYVAYLIKNNTTKVYNVSYKLKSNNTTFFGNGNMGISELSVRHIYNNRIKPNQKNITIFGIICKEY